MTGWMRGLLGVLLGVLALAGCSMETAMNAMSSPEERRFAQDFVSNLRAGNEAWLQEQMEPVVWEQTRSMVKARQGLFPAERGETTMVGYEYSENRGTGGAVRGVNYVLITEAGGGWVETRIATLAENGRPAKVTEWGVVPRGSRPAELAFFEASERAVPWIWAVAIGFLAVVILIVWAIVRSNRRKRAEWESRRQGGRPHG